MRPDEWGFFLVDNEIQNLKVISARTKATISKPEAEVLYEVYSNGEAMFVPACKAAKHKADLLAKL
jgi:hypothetical protein